MIVLIGSHGTGKTTLLEALEKETDEWYISDGYGRPIREAGDILGLTQRDRQIIINTITKHRWNREIKQKKSIFTRSIIDEWAYSKVFGHYDLLFEREEIFKKSDYAKVTYFYIPIEFSLQEDGIRYEGESLQREVDNALLEWIKKFELNVIVLKGSVEQRLKTLKEHI